MNSPIKNPTQSDQSSTIKIGDEVIVHFGTKSRFSVSMTQPCKVIDSKYNTEVGCIFLVVSLDKSVIGAAVQANPKEHFQGLHHLYASEWSVLEGKEIKISGRVPFISHMTLDYATGYFGFDRPTDG
ncbi:MAG TPA: hypothetical protein VN843_06790 [Anaerolineales bacterium]|nr:hypothetical protein [Anaerolineales bacterium]